MFQTQFLCSSDFHSPLVTAPLKSVGFFLLPPAAGSMKPSASVRSWCLVLAPVGMLSVQLLFVCVCVLVIIFIPPCINTGRGGGMLESLYPFVHVSEFVRISNLLNHSTILNQTWHGDVLSRGRVSCTEMGSLSSMARSQ